MNMRCVEGRLLFYAPHPHAAGWCYSSLAMRIYFVFPHARRDERPAGNSLSASAFHVIITKLPLPS